MSKQNNPDDDAIIQALEMHVKLVKSLLKNYVRKDKTKDYVHALTEELRALEAAKFYAKVEYASGKLNKKVEKILEEQEKKQC